MVSWLPGKFSLFLVPIGAVLIIYMLLQKGTIVRDTSGKIPRYKVSGLYSKLDSHTLEITELPIGSWTEKYKEMLESYLVPSAKRKEALIKVCISCFPFL
jgi:hypothetical protein